MIQPLQGEVLTNRTLNRALLARQHLLHRSTMSAIEMIHHLAGIQSQAPLSAYVALWARIEGFSHDDLVRLLLDRSVVRIALMRSTIHLVTADDCLFLRPHLQPALERGWSTTYGKRLNGIDPAEIAQAGRGLVEAQALTFDALGKALQETWPDCDPDVLSTAIRTFVPLVQLPPRGVWGAGGPAAHTSAEVWLGRPLNLDPSLDQMVLRYLAAFGPASVQDAQTWSGLTRLNVVFERLRDQLLSFRSERGVELFDLPDAPRPDPELLVLPRFTSEFDNILLSYADRSRIISDEGRRLIFTKNGFIRATILVDGFVCGTWRVVNEGEVVTLEVEPFARLDAPVRSCLEEQAVDLLRFIAGSERRHDIRFLESIGLS